jgi:molybdate/tungstate transport system substrate-binding protein
MHVTRRSRFLVAVFAALAVVGGVSAASATGAATRRVAPRASEPARSPVDVLYAASLLRPLGSDLAPRFEAVTGDRFVGVAGGSLGLAHQIADGVRQGDVMVSAGTEAQSVLTDAGRARWYAVFAKAPLVLGYEPGGRFAAALRHQPWYDVVTRAGFRLGRTDPAIDPKGQLSVVALRDTALAVHRSGLEAITRDPATVFPEEALLGRVESGQLDAAFLYADEARVARLPYVDLAPARLSMPFAVTILQGAPHPGAALDFVRYLWGRAGSRLLHAEGLVTEVPRAHGAVPASVGRALSAAGGTGT